MLVCDLYPNFEFSTCSYFFRHDVIHMLFPLNGHRLSYYRYLYGQYNFDCTNSKLKVQNNLEVKKERDEDLLTYMDGIISFNCFT